MSRFILISLLCIANNFLIANAQINFKQNINTGINSSGLYNNMMTKRIFCSKLNESIVIYSVNDDMLEQETIGTKQTIYIISPDKKVSKRNFRYPEYLKKQLLMDIAFIDDKMILMVSSKIFKYVRSGNEYLLSETIDNRYNFNNIDVLNTNTLALSVTYDFHPKDQEEQVVIATLGVDSFVIYDIIFPEFHGIEFSHFNHNWVTARNNRVVLINNPLEYEITVLNRNLNKVHNFKIDVRGWVKINADKLEEIKKHRGKDRLFFAKETDKEISRIYSCYFISDNEIIVVYKLSGLYHDIYYDVIKLTGESYEIIYSKKIVPKASSDIASNTFRAILNSKIKVVPDSEGKSFTIPTIYYYPVNGTETIQEFKATVSEYRTKKNKTLGLLQFSY